MNLSQYRAQVRQILYQKRLPTARYVPREGLADMAGSLGAILDQVAASYQASAEFHLLKFRTDEVKLSFLSCPEFESDRQPVLRQAILESPALQEGANQSELEHAAGKSGL
jgi:hypothetical protein